MALVLPEVWSTDKSRCLPEIGGAGAGRHPHRLSLERSGWHTEGLRVLAGLTVFRLAPFS